MMKKVWQGDLRVSDTSFHKGFGREGAEEREEDGRK
jgi:hypothetical protein